MAVLEEITFLHKAKKQYVAAICLFENGYTNDAISRLYYSFRSLCVYLLGRPEKGKWKHYGLMKKLIVTIDSKDKTFLTRKERELIKNFPNIRESADYDLLEIPEEKFKIYLQVVEKLFKFVEKMESKND